MESLGKWRQESTDKATPFYQKRLSDDALRATFEQGASACGLDLRHGPALWHAYRQFEATTDGPEAKARLTKLWQRSLAVPAADLATVVADAEAWWSAKGWEGATLTPILPSAQVRAAQALWAPYEARIAQALDQGDQTACATAFQAYLQHAHDGPADAASPLSTQTQPHPTATTTTTLHMPLMQLRQTYERALATCTHTLALDPTFWRNYVAFLQAHLGHPKARHGVLARAVRHCPQDAVLWRAWLRCVAVLDPTAEASAWARAWGCVAGHVDVATAAPLFLHRLGLAAADNDAAWVAQGVTLWYDAYPQGDPTWHVETALRQRLPCTDTATPTEQVFWQVCGKARARAPGYWRLRLTHLCAAGRVRDVYRCVKEALHATQNRLASQRCLQPAAVHVLALTPYTSSAWWGAGAGAQAAAVVADCQAFLALPALYDACLCALRLDVLPRRGVVDPADVDAVMDRVEAAQRQWHAKEQQVRW